MGSAVHIRCNFWYKPEGEIRKMSHEKSEGVILPLMIETTQLGWREGPLLQPCPARRYVMVHARKGQSHRLDNSRQLQRRLCSKAKRGRLFGPGRMWSVVMGRKVQVSNASS